MFDPGKDNDPTLADNPAAERARAEKVRADNLRILGELGRDYLKERKTKRRWGLFFKFLLAAFVAVVVFLRYYPVDDFLPLSHSALVEISGIIAPEAESADKINRSLRRAFTAKSAGGVILKINSPGGSPVQAAEINAEIGRLKRAHPGKPLYVVIADICTSGGYYVAVAGDRIYANPASLVGSIGVRLDGFGFVESLKKLGIERRLLAAGDDKGMLDPFLPQNPAQVAHAQSVLGGIHRQFIEAVKRGRGERLADGADLFSGLFWSGEQALQLGLIDDFGGVDEVARDVIGAETIVDYTLKSSLLDRFSEQVGARLRQAFSQLLLRMAAHGGFVR